MTGPVGPPGLQSTIGPLFVGLLLSVALQGILIAQGYLYWRTYGSKDSKIFRSLVFALCALELFHTAASAHAGYWYLINNYGRPTAVDHLVWSILSELALTVTITFIGRAFWIRWLYTLSHRNWWLMLITSAFSLAQLGLGIGVVYEGIRKPYFSTISSGKVFEILNLSLSGLAVVAQMLSADLGDVIISLSLCYYLNASRSGIRSTEMLLDRLIMFVVTRGILASGTGFVQLITFFIWPNTFIFGIFHLIASKLYTNALLATMNSREHISRSRRSHTASDPGDTGTSFVLSSFANDGDIRRAFETASETGTTQTVDLLPSRQHTQDHPIALPTSSSSSVPGITSKARYDGASSTAVDMQKPDDLP